MSFFQVFVHKILLGCFVAAHSTRVFHPFMNCSFVLGKTPLWSCLKVTLPARKLEPFMNYSFVLGKIPLWSWLIVTLPAREIYPFMKYSYVLTETTPWFYPVITNFCILTPYFYVPHLDVDLISSLWISVSHKYCNCVSKIHPLCFDEYSGFLPNFNNSSPFPRNSCEVLLLTQLNLNTILIIFYNNSSNKNESRRLFSLSLFSFNTQAP